MWPISFRQSSRCWIRASHGTGGDRSVARLFSGGRWLEGPGYHAAGRFVLFSDIPNDRILRYDEVSERTDVFLIASRLYERSYGRPARPIRDL